VGQEDIAQLIEGLRHFRTRSDAIRKLVECGDKAVEALLNALDRETQEGTRWAILRCLAELKAQQAVARIAPLLDDMGLRTAAHETLVKIVGEDLGPAVRPWLEWASRSTARTSASPLKAEMHLTGLPDDRLMTLALEGCDVKWRELGSGRYLVEARLPDGGVQEVNVDLDRKDHEGEAIIIVYADCGPAAPTHYEYALRRNLQMPYGALAVRGKDDGSRFVMFNTLLRSDTSPIELRKSIMAIAVRAAIVRRDIEGASVPRSKSAEG
jgi:hypothetical protein